MIVSKNKYMFMHAFYGCLHHKFIKLREEFNCLLDNTPVKPVINTANVSMIHIYLHLFISIFKTSLMEPFHESLFKLNKFKLGTYRVPLTN